MLRMLAAVLLLSLAGPAAAAAAPSPSFPHWIVVAENAGTAEVEVTLSEPPAEPFRIPWRTGTARSIADAPGAIPGTDYVETSGTLEFAPGQTHAKLAVTILDDAVDDPGGFFAVEYDLPGAGAAPLWPGPHSLIDLRDDEPTPAASVGDVTVAEDAGSALVPLTRPAVSRLGSAMYAPSTRAGTATAGADFEPPAERAGIVYDQTASSIRIPIVDDGESEGAEQFEVLLAPFERTVAFSGQFPGPVGVGTATVTITDDEPRPVAFITPVRGTVRLSGSPLGARRGAARDARLDARRGAARLDFAGGRVATLSGGVVRLGRPGRLELRTARLAIRATRGVRLDGRAVRTAAASRTARWTLHERAPGTLVRVRRGRVRAGGELLRAGAERQFGG